MISWKYICTSFVIYRLIQPIREIEDEAKTHHHPTMCNMSDMLILFICVICLIFVKHPQKTFKQLLEVFEDAKGAIRIRISVVYGHGQSRICGGGAMRWSYRK